MNSKTIGMSPTALIERADMSLADLTVTGGVGGGILLPEQADAFLDVVYDAPTIFRDARQDRMGSPIKNIDRIGFNSRIVHASPGENVATDQTNRSKPTTTEIQLSPACRTRKNPPPCRCKICLFFRRLDLRSRLSLIRAQLQVL